jgi:metallophosphoesterase (TIGR03767 family)
MTTLEWYVPTPTTLERTLIAGEVAGVGSKGCYRRLQFGAGEPRLVRDELSCRSSTGGSQRRSLVVLAQITDLQLADAQSPGRFEFFEYLRGRPDMQAFVPAYRPQEVLNVHAVDAIAAAIRNYGGSPETGARVGLVLSTGDNVDNAQLNELTWYLSLMGGGSVVASSGGPVYDGVQAPGWPDDLYWHPDPGDDRFKSSWGFPDYAGLLEHAVAPFDTTGVGVGWLSCFGNHDGLVFGESVPTSDYRRIALGSKKAVALPPGLDPIGREVELFSHPERFLAGPRRSITADPGRQIVSRRDFVSAHLAAPGLPGGHGFTERNLADATAYAAYDGVEGLRIVLLDSTNLNGRSDGSLGVKQLAWLEERLSEVHARYFSPAGTPVSTGNEDCLVVLASHHGLASLSNDREQVDGPEEDQPRVTAGEIRALVHRFPNVVLWLNGHRHRNEIVLRRPPDGQAHGFWEVSTVALADWPSQTRVVEIVANDDGTLSILCTMVDHGAAVDPRAEAGGARLASIHRELAANVPGAGLGANLEGGRLDRNVELLLPAPFPLR